MYDIKLFFQGEMGIDNYLIHHALRSLNSVYHRISTRKFEPFQYETYWRNFMAEQKRATFVSRKLDASEIEELKNWLSVNIEDMETFEEMILKEGYRISCKFNDNTDSFVYTVMRPDFRYGSAGLILSRHASALWKARAEALFIHHHLTQGKWENMVGEAVDDWDF